MCSVTCLRQKPKYCQTICESCQFRNRSLTLISQCGAHQKTSTPYMDQTLRKCHLLNIRFMSFLKHPPGTCRRLLTIDERGSKIARNSVFDCHLSPVSRATNSNRKPCFLPFLIHVRR